MDGSGGYNLSTNTTIPISIYQSTEFFVLMAIIMIFALIGNSLVLLIIFCSKEYLLPVSVYVISLAISDISTAVISIPAEIHWDSIGQGRHGNIACKVATYIQCFLFVGRAFVMVSMSYDCYQAICQPLTLWRSRQRSRLMVLLSLTLAAIVSIPQLFIFLQVNTGTSSEGQPQLACRSLGYSATWQRKVYVTWLALCVFVAPMCAMTISSVKIINSVDYSASSFASKKPVLRRYSGERQKMSKVKVRTINLSVCIFLFHMCCWLPYFCLNLLNVWTDYSLKNSIPHFISIVSQAAAWFSSCVNPIIYAVFNLTIAQLQTVFCGCVPPTDQLSEEPFRPRVRQVNRTFSSFRRTTSRHCSKSHQSFILACRKSVDGRPPASVEIP